MTNTEFLQALSDLLDEKLEEKLQPLRDDMLHMKENIKFIELTNKLNQAIPAADNNRAYEVKVNYLLLEVDKIKQTIAEKLA